MQQQPSLIGQTFAGYEIRESLGQGGMGAVYVAHKNGVDYALKVILSVEDARDELRFQREAQAAAQVDRHPNIVRVHSFGREQDRLYMVMELIDGQGLDQQLSESKPWTQEQALALLRKLAGALSAIHKSGLVHRDLKPANIIIRNQDGEPMLTDFGLVKLGRAESLTKTGEILGTPQYMAPEQLEGQEVGPYTDVWAVGVLLYELLTGVRPFQGRSGFALYRSILNGEYPPPETRSESFPAQMAPIIAKALCVDPEQRYADMAALLKDLDRIDAGQVVHAPRFGPRAKWFVIAAVVLLLALGLGQAVLVGLQRADQRQRFEKFQAACSDSSFLKALERDIELDATAERLKRHGFDWSPRLRRDWRKFFQTFHERLLIHKHAAAHSQGLQQAWPMLVVGSLQFGEAAPQLYESDWLSAVSRLRWASEARDGMIKTLREASLHASEQRLAAKLGVLWGGQSVLSRELDSKLPLDLKVLNALPEVFQCLKSEGEAEEVFESFALFREELQNTGQVESLESARRLLKGRLQGYVRDLQERFKRGRPGSMQALLRVCGRAQRVEGFGLGDLILQECEAVREFRLAESLLPTGADYVDCINMRIESVPILPAKKKQQLLKCFGHCLDAFKLIAKLRNKDPECPIPRRFAGLFEFCLDFSSTLTGQQEELLTKLANWAKTIDYFSTELTKKLTKHGLEFCQSLSPSSMQEFWRIDHYNYSLTCMPHVPLAYDLGQMGVFLVHDKHCDELPRLASLGPNYKRLLELSRLRVMVSAKVVGARLRQANQLEVKHNRVLRISSENLAAQLMKPLVNAPPDRLYFLTRVLECLECLGPKSIAPIYQWLQGCPADSLWAPSKTLLSESQLRQLWLSFTFAERLQKRLLDSPTLSREHCQGLLALLYLYDRGVSLTQDLKGQPEPRGVSQVIPMALTRNWLNKHTAWFLQGKIHVLLTLGFHEQALACHESLKASPGFGVEVLDFDLQLRQNLSRHNIPEFKAQVNNHKDKMEKKAGYIAQNQYLLVLKVGCETLSLQFLEQPYGHIAWISQALKTMSKARDFTPRLWRTTAQHLKLAILQDWSISEILALLKTMSRSKTEVFWRELFEHTASHRKRAPLRQLSMLDLSHLVPLPKDISNLAKARDFERALLRACLERGDLEQAVRLHEKMKTSGHDHSDLLKAHRADQAAQRHPWHALESQLRVLELQCQDMDPGLVTLFLNSGLLKRYSSDYWRQQVGRLQEQLDNGRQRLQSLFKEHQRLLEVSPLEPAQLLDFFELSQRLRACARQWSEFETWPTILREWQKR